MRVASVRGLGRWQVYPLTRKERRWGLPQRKPSGSWRHWSPRGVCARCLQKCRSIHDTGGREQLYLARLVGHTDDLGREAAQNFDQVILGGDDRLDVLIRLGRLVQPAAEQGYAALA